MKASLKRTHSFFIRVSPDEKKSFEKNARDFRSVAEYIRMLNENYKVN